MFWKNPENVLRSYVHSRGKYILYALELLLLV